MKGLDDGRERKEAVGESEKWDGGGGWGGTGFDEKMSNGGRCRHAVEGERNAGNGRGGWSVWVVLGKAAIGHRCGWNCGLSDDGMIESGKASVIVQARRLQVA